MNSQLHLPNLFFEEEEFIRRKGAPSPKVPHFLGPSPWPQFLPVAAVLTDRLAFLLLVHGLSTGLFCARTGLEGAWKVPA